MSMQLWLFCSIWSQLLKSRPSPPQILPNLHPPGLPLLGVNPALLEAMGPSCNLWSWFACNSISIAARPPQHYRIRSRDARQSIGISPNSLETWRSLCVAHWSTEATLLAMTRRQSCRHCGRCIRYCGPSLADDIVTAKAPAKPSPVTLTSTKYKCTNSLLRASAATPA